MPIEQLPLAHHMLVTTSTASLQCPLEVSPGLLVGRNNEHCSCRLSGAFYGMGWNVLGASDVRVHTSICSQRDAWGALHFL